MSVRRIALGFTALGFTAALAISGCGSGGGTDAVSIKTLKTAAATAQEQSMRFTLDQRVSFGGKPFTVHADGITSADGTRAQVAVSSELIGDIDVRVLDGVVYVKAGDGFIGNLLPHETPWIKFDAGRMAGAFDPSMSTPQTGLDLLKELSGNVETVGDDTVAGRHAVHYRASIDADALGSGSVPVDVWIDDQDRVVKVQTAIASGSAGLANLGEASMTLEVTEFDVPVDVTAPPDDEVSDFGGLGDGGLI